ncbi:rho GTPase-activating protein REN1-like [Cynara cardunculus var. scolymus]|uniref:rho GTPase-activating protein REN1-like n=1 Tax=Cynara cardunculus var. scolymus TaxID=59895 RepID=UPI000D62DE51|nr:rho GTPase-activating protein REN1-like [Cynara cardunculus var. scolymus]
MMPNPKNNAADSKTNNNNADTKNNNPAAKKNNADVQNNSDSKTNADASAQGDGGGNPFSPHGAAEPAESQHSLNGNKVYKSGPLFLSSKGIGWTSWKKRWFVLTQTSLVFFRSDPNAAPQRGGEANLTLGGIDLNSSGSVVVKADKKLLTVLFPNGREGRTFTLKAETTEDLNEWKAALDEALANAPSISPMAAQSGTVKNEKGDTADGSSEQPKDRSPPKSMVLGRPILLALEDIDGTPSFLEKALRYVEDHGVKVEGILRQAADVEDVEHRIREYEQGKVEFTAEEDAHVIGDCIKYVLRELPSPPIPASCCNALLDAYRTDQANRVNAMRAAICDTFPEPNRRLLQRILIMMEAVADNKNVNRMSVSAVAACMAPLLLRPLLAGECNLESQFSMGGDGSAQLMQAAAAANHAQAIVITLLEEYDNIFGEGDMLSDLYSDSEELGSESEELSEDELYEDDEYEDGEYTSEGSDANEDSEHVSTSSQGESARNHKKGPGTFSSRSISHKVTGDVEAVKKLRSSSKGRSVCQVGDNVSNQSNDHSTRKAVEYVKISEDDNVQASTSRESTDNIQISSTTADGTANMLQTTSQQTAIKPEATKEELKMKTESEELLSKKKALEARRLHLEQEVARLEEQLRKEMELREKLEEGIKISQQALFSSIPINQKAENYREATATSHESKDGNDKHQFHSFSTKLPPHQQLDSHSSKDSDEKHESKDMKKSSSNKTKRLNSKTETTGTNSAMSKITNGLNFLKEKADELQLMNKDRGKNQSQKHTRKGSMDESDGQSSTKPKESSFQKFDSLDRGRRSDDQSTKPEKEKSESLSMDKQHDTR